MKEEIITIMILSMKKNIHNNLNNKISNNHFIKLPNDILFIIFQFLTIDETYEGQTQGYNAKHTISLGGGQYITDGSVSNEINVLDTR